MFGRRLTILATALLALGLPLVAVSGSAGAATTLAWERTIPGWNLGSSPVVADLDGDGQNDIIVANHDGLVRAYRADGSMLPGWPQPVIIRGSAPTAIMGSVTVADVDGDGKNEVVAVAGSTHKENQAGGLVVFSRDGGVRCRWEGIDNMRVWGMDTKPDGYPEGAFSTPAVGDVTGDGRSEIVFGGWDAHIHALDAACREQPGFPWFAGDTVWSSPALYDSDRDGTLEIFIGIDGEPGHLGGVFRALDYRGGGVHELWKQRTQESMMSSPAIGDIDGDGRQEAVIGAGDFYYLTQDRKVDHNKVFAWHLDDGSPVPGWPQETTGVVWSSPSLGDLTGDGLPEVVVGSRDGRVWAWRGTGARLWSVDPRQDKEPTGFAINSSAVVADLDGDGNQDVAIPNDWGMFLIRGRDGARLAPPVGTLLSYGNAAAVGDFGARGWMLVIAGFSLQNETARIAAYSIPRPGKAPDWPMWRKSAGRLGAVLSGCPLPSTNPPGAPSDRSGRGYWFLGRDGGIFAFDVPFYGSVPGLGVRTEVLGMAATPTAQGYWILAHDGGVFAFGDAKFHGNMVGRRLASPIIRLEPTPTGNGYWLLAADGGVFSFGDAVFHGSTGGLRLNSPVISMAATVTGRGYWLLAADGGVFSFGDAVFHGSTGGLRLNSPVISMTPAPNGAGYWLLAADGGVFSFDVPFHGSVPGTGLCRYPAGVQIRASSTGRGYWVLAADGGVFSFGDAKFHGSYPGLSGGRAAIDLAIGR